MNIRSKFRDYYDSAVRFGIDETLLYARFSKIYDFQKLKNNKLSKEWMVSKPNGPADSLSRNRKPYCGELIIGFCGRLYQCVHVVHPAKPFEKDTHEYLYGEKAKKFLVDNHADDYIPSWRRYKKQQAFADFHIKPVKTDDKIFREVNSPIFAIEPAEFNELGKERWGGTKLTTNIRLAGYEFGKCVDAFTAFQEISMYLTNQLIVIKQVEEVADKYRIAQHGFDNLSFRHPTRLSKLK
jgi:hypothetical protein